MKVKKWVRNLSKLLFFIGVCVIFGLAGNCDLYPTFPMKKVLIYTLISIVLFSPYFFIFIRDIEDDSKKWVIKNTNGAGFASGYAMLKATRGFAKRLTKLAISIVVESTASTTTMIQMTHFTWLLKKLYERSVKLWSYQNF